MPMLYCHVRVTLILVCPLSAVRFEIPCDSWLAVVGGTVADGRLGNRARKRAGGTCPQKDIWSESGSSGQRDL